MILEEKNMKNNKKLFISVVSVVLWFFFSTSSISCVYAEEETIGGAIQTNGEITFFDEDPLPSTSETSRPLTSADESKPKGIFPSTGELVKNSFFVSGIVLIVFLACAYLLKQKKGKQTGRE